jgi:AraC-like DNA-binding protein
VRYRCLQYCLLLLCLIYIPVFNAPIKFLSPKPFKVITGNYIQIRLQADKSYDSLKLISSFSTSHQEAVQDTFIHTWLSPPYEYIWDVRDIPDQAWFTLGAIGFVKGSSDLSQGCLTRRNRIELYLDRHKPLNSQEGQSWFVILASPKERDWKAVPKYGFEGNTNKITWQSLWNTDSLFFRITVADDSICIADSLEEFPIFETKKGSMLGLFKSDFIELCFDLKHNHNVIREWDDPEFLIDAMGRSSGNRWNARRAKFSRWGNEINSKVEVIKERDSINLALWQVRLAIPWKILLDKESYIPARGKKIGFEIINGDLDKINSKILFTSWGGIEFHNNDNPSEWANLVLIQKRITARLIRITGIIVFIIFYLGFWFYYYKRQIQYKSETPQKRYSRRMEKILKYIDENCTDNDFNRQSLAKKMGLHEDYISRLVKQELNENLVSIINQRRIEKAKALLKQTDKTISEIAYMVGFNNLEYFISNFKKFTQITPSEFRNQT